MTRRELILKSIKNISIFISGGIVWSMFKGSKSEIFLRPPGAIKEDLFLNTCIKCGSCVVACKFDTLKLADLSLGVSSFNTPIFTPREIPCYLCEDFPCVKACPTDALNKKSLMKNNKFEISKAKMGLALIEPNSCIAFFGIQCDVCYRACPFMDKALKQVFEPNTRTKKHANLIPSVDATYCVGCGKCEHACVTKKPSIKVFPRSMLGEMDSNYIKGWVIGDDKRLNSADTKVRLDKQKAINYLNDGEL